jgi:hypothetical protein
MNRVLLVIGVVSAALFSGFASAGLTTSDTCLPDVTQCRNDQQSPSGISSCRSIHQTECSPTRSCEWCDGMDWSAPHTVCVQDHIYSGDAHHCTNNGTTQCGLQRTSTCGWTSPNGPCYCNTTVGESGDPCLFPNCTN